MTTDLVLRDVELGDLAARIRVEHEAVGVAIASALERAIRAGDLLLEARKKFEGWGGGEKFAVWVESECGLKDETARRWMRIAHYQELLPEGISQSEATAFLKGLPSWSGHRSGTEAFPEQLVAQAKAMRKEGLTYKEISEQLGTSITTVGRWVLGAKARRGAAERAKRQRQLAKLGRREALRSQALAAAKEKGGSLGKAYSLLRSLTQELDRAAAAAEDKQVRKELNTALPTVMHAENHVSAALGVDYGSWRG